jgi:serine/threonine protein kinase
LSSVFQNMAKRKIIKEAPRAYESMRDSRKRNESKTYPFTESEVFFREHTDLLMQIREIRVMASLTDESEQSRNELKKGLRKFQSDLTKEASNKEEEQEILMYAAERIESGLLDINFDPKERSEISGLIMETFGLSVKQIKEVAQVIQVAEKQQEQAKEVIEEDSDIDDQIEAIRLIVSEKKRALNIVVKEKKKGASKPITISIKEKIDAVAAAVEKKARTKSAPERAALMHSVNKRINGAWGLNEHVNADVSKKFLFRDRIATGGQGEIYSAAMQNPHLIPGSKQEGENDFGWDEVIVKVLSPHASKDGTPIDHDEAVMFKNELEILKTINHPNIAKFHDGDIIATGRTELSGEPEFGGWIAMERLSGQDLKKEQEKRIAEEKGFSVEDILTITQSIGSALDALHQKGLVHRDIKGMNIMIDSSKKPPVVKLIDFGTAVSYTEIASEEGVLNTYGTILYASPEQLFQEKLSPKSDLFSLGILLYELVNNEHPFVSASVKAKDSPIGIMTSIANDPQKEFANQSCPIEIKNLISSLLVKEVDQRMSGEQLREKIQEIRKQAIREKLLETDLVAPTREPSPSSRSKQETINFRTVAEEQKTNELYQFVQSEIGNHRERFTSDLVVDILRASAQSSTESQRQAILDKLVEQDVIVREQGSSDRYKLRSADNQAKLNMYHDLLSEKEKRVFDQAIKNSRSILSTGFQPSGELSRDDSSGFPRQVLSPEPGVQPTLFLPEMAPSYTPDSKVSEVVLLNPAPRNQNPPSSIVSAIKGFFGAKKPNKNQPVTSREAGFKSDEPLYELRYHKVENMDFDYGTNQPSETFGCIVYLPETEARQLYQMIAKEPRLARTMMDRLAKQQFPNTSFSVPDFTKWDEGNRKQIYPFNLEIPEEIDGFYQELERRMLVLSDNHLVAGTLKREAAAIEENLTKKQINQFFKVLESRGLARKMKSDAGDYYRKI